MGNSPGGLRLLKDEDCSYHVQLGNSVAIDLKKEETKEKCNGIKRKTWKLSYDVDGSNCVLNFTKTTGGNPNDEEIEIEIVDLYENKIIDKIQGKNINDNITLKYSNCFRDRIRREEAGLFQVDTFSREIERKIKNSSIRHLTSLYTRKNTNACGFVTETTVHMYGSGTRKGLHVREWKKKRGDQNPYMGTVAHYFAYFKTCDRTDIGLSVVVKIRVLDDGTLNFDVEGPIQHPCSALFHMFDEVNRTRIWKPTSCPHCANIQRQRNFMFSDSEDSDNNNNLPEARPRSRNQDSGSFLANDGVVKGNGNGNFTVKNLVLKGS
ncbi:uncharacterized protein LOC133299821 isoform X2 [Gastrolobium bilobum]|nr:uncharacterized protein LOC133299821 isoform X2 [Gastrolobium bilobum]